jgi:hypothetical protein
MFSFPPVNQSVQDFNTLQPQTNHHLQKHDRHKHPPHRLCFIPILHPVKEELQVVKHEDNCELKSYFVTCWSVSSLQHHTLHEAVGVLNYHNGEDLVEEVVDKNQCCY